MIANPEKFHALLLRKNQTYTSGEQININGKIIKSEETVKLLGVTLDYRLDFDPHISNICKDVHRVSGEKDPSSEFCIFKFRLLSLGLVFLIFQIFAEDRKITRTRPKVSL